MIFKVLDNTLKERIFQKVDPETAVLGKSPVLYCFTVYYIVQFVIKYYQLIFIICYNVQFIIVSTFVYYKQMFRLLAL